MSWPYLVFAFVACWAGATIALDVREARRHEHEGSEHEESEHEESEHEEAVSVADEAHDWLQKQS